MRNGARRRPRGVSYEKAQIADYYFPPAEHSLPRDITNYVDLPLLRPQCDSSWSAHKDQRVWRKCNDAPLSSEIWLRSRVLPFLLSTEIRVDSRPNGVQRGQVLKKRKSREIAARGAAPTEMRVAADVESRGFTLLRI